MIERNLAAENVALRSEVENQRNTLSTVRASTARLEGYLATLNLQIAEIEVVAAAELRRARIEEARHILAIVSTYLKPNNAISEDIRARIEELEADHHG